MRPDISSYLEAASKNLRKATTAGATTAGAMVVDVNFKASNISTSMGFGKKKEPGGGSEMLEDMGEACTLSWKARLIGFLVCLIVGIIVVALGYFTLIIRQKIVPFTVLYSVGNIVALCSTGFLVGPLTQLKKMFESGRIVCTIVYLSMIGLTIFFGLRKKAALAILCTVLQVLALIWYSMSYIPFARRAFKKCIGI